jgi:glycosyltransferase involved in cell wall biosynthesis
MSNVARVTRVSVVVPARNSAATLPRTLEALRRQELAGDHEVIVVDDGSTDDTAAIAERAGVSVLHQRHEGPARARDRGVSAAAGKAIAFTDADCFPQPGWLARGLAALASADLVQGAVHPDPSEPMGPFDRSIWAVEENGLYETANLFVTRELFDRVGGFGEWVEPERGKILGEDILFGWKARRLGARTAFCPEALVHHAVFPRRLRDHVLERRRLVHFPELARRVPELRRHLFFARWFLSRRTAAFDAALPAAALALARRSPLPLAAALPYAVIALHEARYWRRRAPAALAGNVLADAVGLASLLEGSARRRSLVL